MRLVNFELPRELLKQELADVKAEIDANLHLKLSKALKAEF